MKISDMFFRLTLYINTIRYMKSSQIYYRIKKLIGLKCTIGQVPCEKYNNIENIATPIELDFDAIFLHRFDVNEFLEDKVTFLHSSRKFDWNGEWKLEKETTLWNFNLHYFEFLFPFIKAYQDTKKFKYLEKTYFLIRAWINQNPKGKGIGWSPYTIAVRLTNWISYYEYVKDNLDDNFRRLILNSMHEQYRYLAIHIEKHLLGNHYFEDLKALVLCAVFFNDEKMLESALHALKKECKEEILPDGMHFELSPMYHKIILEGILRVAIALRGINRRDEEIEKYIQPMLDVAWSFEGDIKRVPLFNDSGDNIAKSLKALVSVSEKYFDVSPHFKSQLADSGFYFFGVGKWKLIVDAGQPGPKYIPGHTHCDAMSFELFYDGAPVIVNCGTYAYQCEKREYFRSTKAHNTVLVDDTEQSQCWSTFRLAKRSSVKLKRVDDDSIDMELLDQRNNKVERKICIRHGKLKILDKSEKHMISSFFHFIPDIYQDFNYSSNTNIKVERKEDEYAEEYGKKTKINTLCLSTRDALIIEISLGSIQEKCRGIE